MFGIDGTRAEAAGVELLRETGACGAVLVGRNIESPAQVQALVDGYEQALGRRLLWAVDHEGGWVVRFRRGMTPFPGNMALGHAVRRLPDAPAQQGRVMASQLRACGITVNFAPVLDVATADCSPAVTIRSLGNAASHVARTGAALVRAMQEAGVHATAKHWPGTGAARQDTHVTLPTVGGTLDDLRRREFVPFAEAVKAGVRLIMSTHVHYPALDGPQPVPATFSARAAQILRTDLEFDGVLVTDDLGMGAILERSGAGEAAVRAREAGHDVLLMTHERASQLAAHEAVVKAARGGPGWERTVARIEKLLSPGAAAERLDGDALALDIARAAVRVERDPLGVLPLDGKAVWVVPRYDALTERYAFEDELGNPAERVRQWTGAEVVEVPVEPADDASVELAHRLHGRTCAFVCFDAMRYEHHKRMMQALQAACPRFVCVAVRNPWDAQLCRWETTIVHAWGFRTANLRAAVEAVRPGGAR